RSIQEAQSRVFAALPTAEFTEIKENQQGLEPKAVTGQVREVQVTGAAEASCPADRASMRFSVTSSKESAGEVTVSVTRRLDYILQALRQHGIRGEDTSVRKFLQRNADTYCMDAEVVVVFSNFEKMEQIRSVLLEKLDKSVFVGTPLFYHSPELCLCVCRQRACVSAVENAQQKASKISQVLGQSLGPPLLVREKETREWKVEEEEEQRSAPHIPVVTASSCVSVSFSFRDRNRKKL
uniref:Interleukin-1 receptor-associated kinase 1 binding protein 1 n=1 Tax=Nothobranchius furzeri TaxID=105023 RepID=A0A8C6KJW4_NOTFU